MPIKLKQAALIFLHHRFLHNHKTYYFLFKTTKTYYRRIIDVILHGNDNSNDNSPAIHSTICSAFRFNLLNTSTCLIAYWIELLAYQKTHVCETTYYAANKHRVATYLNWDLTNCPVNIVCDICGLLFLLLFHVHHL